ncbi:hypothetical protein [Helicobacter felis]|uniref:hypothetical protein n=2 Tax=Helicobacter felis TaxID=214 RepID=UPI000CF180C7|nr:hypothetical protein [Helicobacter felis]
MFKWRAKRLNMELYNKVQELLEANKRAKAESMGLLELARTTLSKQIEAQFEAKATELQEAFNHALERQIQNTQLGLDVSARLEELASQEVQAFKPKLEQGIKNALLAQLDHQMIAAQVQEALKAEINDKLDLEQILGSEGLSAFLERVSAQIAQSASTRTQEVLDGALISFNQRAENLLEEELIPLVKGQIAHIDFSFLKAQHEVFYPALKNHLKDMFFEELQKDFMQTYWKSFVEDILAQQAQMRRFKEMELEAQGHLESLLLGNALKMLQEQEMTLQKAYLEDLQLANQIQAEVRRKELIKQGILQEPSRGTRTYRGDS